MTLARLLAGAGELSRAGFMCEACDRDPSRKERLGCMKPPLAAGLMSGATHWSTADYKAFCEREDIEQNPVDASSWWYENANYWDISRWLDGQMWECCPRSYAEFSTQAAQVSADEIINASVDIRAKLPNSWILGGAQPTSQVKSIVRMAVRVIDELRHRDDKKNA